MTSTLPAGSDNLFAVYNGDSTFASSTSPVIVQVVLAKPGHAMTPTTTGSMARPDRPTFRGLRATTSSGSRTAHSKSTDPTETTASGVATATTTTPAATATTTSPAETGTTAFPQGMATMTSKWATERTNQPRWRQRHGLGWQWSRESRHCGQRERRPHLWKRLVQPGALGSGTDVVTLQGSQDSISGTGNDTVYLGGGTGNTFNGATHHTNICHLPTPPPPGTELRRLLPRHTDELHGGEPMSSRTTRQRGRFGRRVGMFLVILWAAALSFALGNAAWSYFESTGTGVVVPAC